MHQVLVEPEELKFPDGDWGEGRASVCEESHDSERGRVICSCPFITFIKVWGEDTCSLSDLFCQSQQWWDSQLGSLLQSDPSVNIEAVEHDRTACLILEDVHGTHLVLILCWISNLRNIFDFMNKKILYFLVGFKTSLFV